MRNFSFDEIDEMLFPLFDYFRYKTFHEKFIIFRGTVKSVTRYNGGSRMNFRKVDLRVSRQKLFNVSETTRGADESRKNDRYVFSKRFETYSREYQYEI